MNQLKDYIIITMLIAGMVLFTSIFVTSPFAVIGLLSTAAIVKWLISTQDK